MIDASVIVDAFGGAGERGLDAAKTIRNGQFAAPFHVDLEAISAWRRHVHKEEMDLGTANTALRALRRLRLHRYPHEPLLERIWQLRDNLTVSDAAYVALSEQLDVPLLTSDARLVNAPGPRCEFELIS